MSALQPKFSLMNSKAKLANVNPRAELHGEDKLLAVDLTVEVTGTNNVLSEFHPSLKSAFYKKDDAAQGELIDDDNHLPQLKFPEIEGFKWQHELDNYKVVVHYGIGGPSDITMQECKVDSFKFTTKEGGTVVTKFRIQCHPTPEETGKLCGLIQQDINLSLVHVAPAANEEFQEAA
ncbi:hypothetical protein [Methylovorus glucosotrophus]|uniref:Uncharacterized protein n=1 Tax=Methylovorus glucosotrophus (strain SIP3-4) TaxID=582744 RepID=C6XED3_METGS|nr:hypothetical protein [Methylovorus glucosotrophus]ACT50908.1 conserved hypothetical protein [Methylovorus glucosotrophus SIP3-4]